MVIHDYTELFQHCHECGIVIVDEVGIKFKKRGNEKFPSGALNVSKGMRIANDLVKDVLGRASAPYFYDAYAIFFKNHPLVPEDVRKKTSMANKQDLKNILTKFYVTDRFNWGGYCVITYADLKHELSLGY
jgi:hypothetical protein